MEFIALYYENKLFSSYIFISYFRDYLRFELADALKNLLLLTVMENKQEFRGRLFITCYAKIKNMCGGR